MQQIQQLIQKMIKIQKRKQNEEKRTICKQNKQFNRKKRKHKKHITIKKNETYQNNMKKQMTKMKHGTQNNPHPDAAQKKEFLLRAPY